MADMPKPEGSLCIHCLSATCCGERLREQLEAARRCVEAATNCLHHPSPIMSARACQLETFDEARSEFDRVMGKGEKQ